MWREWERKIEITKESLKPGLSITHVLMKEPIS